MILKSDLLIFTLVLRNFFALFLINSLTVFLWCFRALFAVGCLAALLRNLLAMLIIHSLAAFLRNLKKTLDIIDQILIVICRINLICRENLTGG